MGDPLATFGSSPSAFRAILKIIEKPLIFTAFLSIEVIWQFSGGALAALGGPREVLIGVDLAQGEDLGGYVRGFQNTDKGQRPLTFRGWGGNGR